MNDYAIKSLESEFKDKNSFTYYDLEFHLLPNFFPTYEKHQKLFKSLKDGDHF